MSMDLADYHRIALLVDCETIDEVIGWADSEIGRVESPPISLIEVSLGRSKPIAELTNLLSILVVDPNDDSALFAVLHKIAGMVRDGLWSPDDAIDRIDRYAKSKARNQELRYAFISLAEDLSCIRNGVYWTDDVTDLRGPLLLTIDRFCSANTNEDDRTMP
jgi:hypothetical protein